MGSANLNRIKRIGKYEILEILGKGGMGVVYKATDPAIGRLVAIKVITTGFAENPSFLKRFYREAQSTGKLQHPNIVIVYELGEQDGTPFLVMEYLEGESLQTIINARRQMPMLDKIGIIVQACNGLQYAHRRNIVHRDIKPANLMVLKDGVVKLVDFGIARIGDESVTLPGQVVGSIQYMSPEQISGVAVDCRTDVFSTGVVLYQLLTYKLPFEGKDTGSTLLKIVNEAVPPLRDSLDSYPSDLDYVLSRALAKSRDDRYATAEDFAFELGQVQEQLKQELVAKNLKVAEELISQSALTKAREQLFQILRIDGQNRRANDLLKDVQRLMLSQKRSEQVQQLRAHATEAVAARDFDSALNYLEQALTLDSSNTELRQLRDSTADSKARLQKAQEALRRAESSQMAGELDEALAAVEEALASEPDDAEAKALHATVTRELSERNRQHQIQELLDEAQRQISSRSFTDAIEAIKKAEALDPGAPAIKDMLTLAANGREQERKRKEIERLTANVQDALNRDDYVSACERADEAVAAFPNDRGLAKLKALAEKQRQNGEKRQFVDQQIATARRLLQERQTEQALETLEAASKRYPAEPALISLLTAVRENLHQERVEARKKDYITRAKEALRRKDYEEATEILEVGRAELDAPELDDLLQFVKDESAGHTRQIVVDASAQEVHRLMSSGSYEEAVDFLKGVLQDVPDEELQILLADAQRQHEDFNRRVKETLQTAERLLNAGRVIEAVRYLESQSDPCGRAAEFRAVLERAHAEQDRLRAVAKAVQSARAALAVQDFAGASSTVTQCREAVGDHPDLARMATDIESSRREAAVKAVSRAISDCRMLLLGRSYQGALDLLDGVAANLDLVPAELRERHATLHEEATRGLQRARQRKEAQPPGPEQRGAKHEEDDTQQQLEWTAPATSAVAAATLHRQRDLHDLAQLERESETVTHWAALDAVSQRARVIAKRHPGDSEVESLAASVTDKADTRALELTQAVDAAAQFRRPPVVPVEQSRPPLQDPPPRGFDDAFETVVQLPSEITSPRPPAQPVSAASAAAPAAQPEVTPDDATVYDTPWPRDSHSAASPPPPEVAPNDATVYDTPWPRDSRSAASPPPPEVAPNDATVYDTPWPRDSHSAASPPPPEVTPDSATVYDTPWPRDSRSAASPPQSQPAPIPMPPPVRTPPIQREATAKALDAEVVPAPRRSGPVAAPAATSGPGHGRMIVLAGSLLAILIVGGGLAWWLKATPSVDRNVVVQTTPAGATVRVQDSTCITPKCKLELAPGVYQLAISLPGYAPRSVTVQVERGKTPPTVNVALQALQPALRIYGNFPDANVWMDDRQIGALHNGQLATERFSAGEHAVKVAGPDGQAEFRFASSTTEPLRLKGPVRASGLSALVASASTGSTRVDCNCTEPLDLSVDGRPIGQLTESGSDLGALAEGTHELQLGTGADTRSYTFKIGASPSLEVFLNAQRNAGTLVVETDPADADVFVNGKRYHSTNGMFRMPLDVTHYTVRAEKNGYQPGGPEHVHILKNQESRVTFKLTPQDNRAFLAIRGGVPGARVSVDRKPVGQIGADGQFYSPALEPGEHVIEMQKEGYQSRILEMEMKGGEILNITADEAQMPKTGAASVPGKGPSPPRP